jgi:hypothetical protein
MLFYVSIYLLLSQKNVLQDSTEVLIYTPDKNHLALADLYGSSNTTAADLHRTAAASLKAGILDLLWDSQKVGYSFF